MILNNCSNLHFPRIAEKLSCDCTHDRQSAIEQGRNAMNADPSPDLCIIGGGSGGFSLALGVAACGGSVVLVEKGALGGRRLTEAIPRHALLAASRAATSARRAAAFRIAVPEPQIDFARVRQHAAAALAAIAPNYTQARLEAMNVKVIRAPGRFTHPDTCAAGGEKIKARRFVIATGSVDKSLPIPGLDLVRRLNCAALCALDRPPRCLIVIGADPDGLAVAQAMRRLGSEAIVLTEGEILVSEDEELAAPVRAAFARDDVVVHENVRISRIEPRGDGIRVFIAAAGHRKSVAGFWSPPAVRRPSKDSVSPRRRCVTTKAASRQMFLLPLATGASTRSARS